MERFVDVGDGYRLWAQSSGAEESTPLLLIMGANASSAVWPPEFVDALAERHRVIVYDHRDTGRSTEAFRQRPYAIRDLAGDALEVLDAFGIEAVHAVGMSMGGTLVQLLIADHPHRLRSATVFCTTALDSADNADNAGPPDVELPGPDPRLLAMWEQIGQPRDPEAELAWRVEHWRLLNGEQLPFQPEVWRQVEARVSSHAGHMDNPSAHAEADQGGLDRGGELRVAGVRTLVIDAPADPVNPPPMASHLAVAIGNSHLVTIPKMGHALHPDVIETLTATILHHTTAIDGAT